MACELVPKRITNDFDDYTEYENAVYNAYLNSYSQKQFTYNSKPIREKRHPLIAGKSCTFWHIVSSGTNEDNKLPDFNRYETVSWPGFILSYCLDNCSSKLVWKNKRGSHTRVLIYCQDIDYLVVLDEHEDYYLFWTGYPVTYTHTKNKLLKEYNDYISSNSSL